WQSDECCERVEVRHGLRVIRLGPAGFKVNGKVLSLSGIAREALTGDKARRWHEAGCNTLLANVGGSHVELWAVAEQSQFLLRSPRRVSSTPCRMCYAQSCPTCLCRGSSCRAGLTQRCPCRCRTSSA